MKKKIAVLTSSRADYGIYLPLLKLLKKSPDFDLEIIAFGTHLSEKFGMTINNILNDGFKVNYKVDTLPDDDSPKSISLSMAKTMGGLAEIWGKERFDLIFALGDRYEMFAAVASSVPFNIPVAHIHGGETTTGAIDNVFRHSITCMAKYHFTCAEPYKQRVEQITGSPDHVYNVGALSLDTLTSTELLSVSDFKTRFGIDLALPSILITFHPETVGIEKNKIYIAELIAALEKIKNYQLIITMPNADTMGLMIRQELNRFIEKTDNAIGIESFGTLGYLSCMKHCRFLLGNTSSGFVEASFFPKPVVNIGNRQNGRIITPNIIECEARSQSILNAVKQAGNMTFDKPVMLYGNGHTAAKITDILKNI
jgi:GDP/UDP-N,N'-diacetylbacillosamine 2-epimerase (hydrolysing)